MEVILREDIEKLGKAGDVVDVKPGYARNYLLPKGLALQSTSENLKLLEREKEKKRLEFEREKEAAQQIAEKLKSSSCTIAVQAGVDDKLYGSVTPADIAKALEEEGIKIDKRKILLEEPITTLGIYQVQIKLHPEITASIKVWVVKE